ncbi:MAG: hypothetical protein A2X28_05370 [Elusimicrobia bacterium GWA2_56_46]|nr:MAG: hypothetical protein A2X28_05370 [Elusimicrobia bacterium GWA2_56_46]OGR55290.1 MAG: hypothetical protein A2X39_04535 [Elusimicrobia bacterium GWC2_56_31]HBB66182.1 hypothetical protein [Elusimicrobiota bacterium]HBW23495.1 hypothetical protein [Elusimicrobiota bacterium]
MKKTKRVLIASGGTGGHFYPGLALANELREAGGWEPLFLVKKGDISLDTLRDSYYPYAELDMISLPRTLNPLAHAAFCRKLSGSLMTCLRIIADFKPVFVAGTGSYVSFPAVLAAALKGIPSMIHDSNAVFGLANRLSGIFASKAALGLPVKNNPFKTKSELTGTPIRDFFSKMPPAEEAKRKFSFNPDVPVTLVFGGSQGARRINQAVLETARKLKAAGAAFQLLHITGKRGHAELLDKYRAEGLAELPGLKILDYCERMDEAYAAADLVISRSGGSTISELARLEKPAILIPLPGSPGDHQKANAEILSGAGAAILLEETPGFSEELYGTIKPLLDEPARIGSMKQRFKGLALPDPLLAAGALRAIMEKYTGGNK